MGEFFRLLPSFIEQIVEMSSVAQSRTNVPGHYKHATPLLADGGLVHHFYYGRLTVDSNGGRR